MSHQPDRRNGLAAAKNSMNYRTKAISIALYVCAALLLSSCERADERSSSNQVTGADTSEAGLYFSTNRSGNYELVRLKNTNDPENLEYLTTNSRFDSWWPRQSPDGKSILFYRSLVSDRPSTGGHNNNYDNAALWSLDLQTQTMTELISKNENGWNAQGVVDWAPDGSTLIMAAIEGSSNRWHLYTTNADGSNVVKISSRSSLFLDPSWSPDGSQIVYAAFPPDYNGIDLARLEIYIADANGQNEIRLTDDNLRDHDPYWSPDGSTIAFETAVEPLFVGVGKWAIRTVDPMSAEVTTVLNDGNINTLPRWGKNGETIYFHRFIFGSGHGFIVAAMRADGSGYRQVSLGGDYDDTDLDWYRKPETN